MATTATVQDLYNSVCAVLLEPYDSGASPGLSLGVVTQNQFLDIFSVVLLDYLNKTGLAWEVFTQQLLLNQPGYLFPPDINTVKCCFVGGVHIDHTSLQDLDDWSYNWRSRTGNPEYWHEDGLPPKTIEVAPNPNYTGVAYPLPVPVDPTAQPPYGVYGAFSPTDGNLTIIGTKGLLGNSFTLSSVIPVVTDSLTYGLYYGILARIFSQDGEAKDEQRAQYCQARYTESINLAAAISGEMLQG